MPDPVEPFPGDCVVCGVVGGVVGAATTVVPAASIVVAVGSVVVAVASTDVLLPTTIDELVEAPAPLTDFSELQAPSESSATHATRAPRRKAEVTNFEVCM